MLSARGPQCRLLWRTDVLAMTALTNSGPPCPCLSRSIPRPAIDAGSDHRPGQPNRHARMAAGGSRPSWDRAQGGPSGGPGCGTAGPTRPVALLRVPPHSPFLGVASAGSAPGPGPRRNRLARPMTQLPATQFLELQHAGLCAALNKSICVHHPRWRTLFAHFPLHPQGDSSRACACACSLAYAVMQPDSADRRQQPQSQLLLLLTAR